MKPKEKAIELVRKHWLEINNIAENSISWRQGKQCALISVDLILDSNNLIFNKDYWQEVKQEIQKL